MSRKRMIAFMAFSADSDIFKKNFESDSFSVNILQPVYCQISQNNSLN